MKLKVLKTAKVLEGVRLLQLHILKFSDVAAYFTEMNWP